MVRAKDVAAKVKLPKRKFFFPDSGITVEAATLEEAEEAARAKKPEAPVSDNS